MFQGGFDDNFSGYPENWLSASRRWGVENNENSKHAQGRRLSLLQTKGNVWNRLRFLKKHFMFLEELNRTIRGNGINLRLSCIYLACEAQTYFRSSLLSLRKLTTTRSKSALRRLVSTPLKTFPGCLITATKHSDFAFFPDFSHLFSDSVHFFRDPWVPVTFFPAATLVVHHIPIKIRENNNVLTQHSVNAHTKPLNEKQRWVMRGGGGGNLGAAQKPTFVDGVTVNVFRKSSRVKRKIQQV